MKLRHLESHLENVERFKEPKIALEQYVTSPHIAACMIHTAETRYNDISGKVVADLGCGCGVLSIAASLMECDFCFSIDIDEDALEICYQNCEEFEACNIDLIQADVAFATEIVGKSNRNIDTVIMNPPFGTKNNQGVDMMFLNIASKMAKHTIYSLHKTSTRSHVFRKAKEFGLQAEVVAELRYDLPSSHKFHKSRTKDIEVDFIRFEIV
ncbi:rRNA N(6)-adenosine-methyltransferase METTL5-like [Styela clava]